MKFQPRIFAALVVAALIVAMPAFGKSHHKAKHHKTLHHAVVARKAAVSGPTATFTWTPTKPAVNQAATFTWTGTCPAGGCVYEWLFWDGHNFTPTGKTTTFAWTDTGAQNAVLEVTDKNGKDARVVKQVTVVKATTPPPTTTTTTVPPPPPPPPPAGQPCTTSTGAPGTTDGQGGCIANPPPTTTTTTTPPPPPPPPPGPCGVSTPNVPDGPDPFGGCWPGPSNTGVPSPIVLTPYTGPCTITTANTVIDSKQVECPDGVVVDAAGLVITNSYIHGNVLQPDNVTFAFSITDSTVDGHNTPGQPAQYACVNCGVGYRNFTMLRVEVTGTNRGAYCEQNCHVTDSWVHGTDLWPDDPRNPHASAIRLEQFSNLEHNSLACDYTGPFKADIGCSADLSGYPDFVPIHDNTVDRNLLESNNVGTAFCAYGGGTNGKPFSGDPTNATNVKYTNNVFQGGADHKCGEFGPITDFITGRSGNVWSGNVWDFGGTVAPG